MSTKSNLVLDLSMFGIFLVIANPRFTGTTVHEWLAVSFSAAILTHLLRHGIQAREVNLEIGTIPVDNVLMNFAWEHGCDLLVMGVYARTVRGSLAVGPIARLFFEQMTLPVLMSG